MSKQEKNPEDNNQEIKSTLQSENMDSQNFYTQISNFKIQNSNFKFQISKFKIQFFFYDNKMTPKRFLGL